MTLCWAFAIGERKTILVLVCLNFIPERNCCRPHLCVASAFSFFFYSGGEAPNAVNPKKTTSKYVHTPKAMAPLLWPIGSDQSRYGEAQYGFYDIAVTKQSMEITSINWNGGSVKKDQLPAFNLSVWWFWPPCGCGFEHFTFWFRGFGFFFFSLGLASILGFVDLVTPSFWGVVLPVVHLSFPGTASFSHLVSRADSATILAWF